MKPPDWRPGSDNAHDRRSDEAIPQRPLDVTPYWIAALRSQ